MSAIVLRAASGPDVGLGHVMRSRSVAQALGVAGAEAQLVVDDVASAERLAGEGFDVRVADDGGDWRAGVKSAWLDGFRDWSADLDALRAAGALTLLVENRSPARERADVIVYPSLHHVDDEWDAAHPGRVRSGAAWVPLPREVLAAIAPAERDVDLVVTFGGSDPGGLTERSLDALAGWDGHVAVLVGPAARGRLASIRRCSAPLARAELVVDDAHPAPLFARARVALTAVGTTLYELAWLRVPALVLANYEGDAEALAHYAREGPHRPLGVAAEVDAPALARALIDGLEDLRAAPTERPPELGGGGARIAELLIEGTLAGSSVSE